MQRIAAITLLIGSAVAWFGESRPIIAEVYGGAPNPQQIIDSDPSAWTAAMVLMVLGAFVAAIGLVLLARHLQSLTDDQNARRASAIGAAAALISVLCYAVTRYYNITLPWETSGPLELPLAVAFFALWQIGLILIAYALLRTGYPNWLGWPVIALAALMLAGSLVAGGLPPALYYFAVLFMGIALLFVREPQPAAAPQMEGAGA
jgi:multisubunit Na+/H+ antiporter MnhG subunit